ncbi:hypothetical protein Cgig2_012834 [Carnegiea gigantea]|uniref:Uncharacterized protein n=1 Tax=Carnegiea gigantea TaxID=171969 RepID=A0A9Q1K9M2_9CARY|nr:hypothetical protein Cgig2_012834 [Carnegiea gigantea]
MMDTITQQVSEQVKMAMETANSAMPLPHFDYIPAHGGEPSHRPERVPSPPLLKAKAGGVSVEPERSALYEVRGHPMLQRPPLMTAPPKPQNARKYCEFHVQSEHTTTECRDLKKALHELADKAWKAQLRSAQQVLTTKQVPRTAVPTTVFGGKKAP